MCKQSSQQSDQSCFCTNTRTTHTRQNKPSRPGVVWAGVVGARGRCCRSCRGTEPLSSSDGARSCIAEIAKKNKIACGVRCCIAEIAEKNPNNIIDRNTELCHHRPRSKAHSNEYENNTHKAEQSLPAWRGAGRSSRGTKPLLYLSLIHI